MIWCHYPPLSFLLVLLVLLVLLLFYLSWFVVLRPGGTDAMWYCEATIKKTNDSMIRMVDQESRKSLGVQWHCGTMAPLWNCLSQHSCQVRQ